MWFWHIHFKKCIERNLQYIVTAGEQHFKQRHIKLTVTSQNH